MVLVWRGRILLLTKNISGSGGSLRDYHNWITRVDIESRGGYRSPTIHYSYHNQGEHGILLNCSVDTVTGDVIVG